jgi:hypothetical protein
MATEGVQGVYVETRNYGATAAFWASMGFKNVFESDHGSGQWVHPAGGPYIFINEQHEGELGSHLILGVADAERFAPDRAPEFARPFTPQHWDVLEAHVRDPDGRIVSLQAPMTEGHRTPGDG